MDRGRVVTDVFREIETSISANARATGTRRREGLDAGGHLPLRENPVSSHEAPDRLATLEADPESPAAVLRVTPCTCLWWGG